MSQDFTWDTLQYNFMWYAQQINFYCKRVDVLMDEVLLCDFMLVQSIQKCITILFDYCINGEISRHSFYYKSTIILLKTVPLLHLQFIAWI